MARLTGTRCQFTDGSLRAFQEFLITQPAIGQMQTHREGATPPATQLALNDHGGGHFIPRTLYECQ